MTIQETLQSTGLPCSYVRFRETGKTPMVPPYIVYVGDGQDTFEADNTYYWNRTRYQIEYYFTDKDEENETAIENALLENGFLYDKSEDVPIEDEGVFVIYYYV